MFVLNSKKISIAGLFLFIAAVVIWVNISHTNPTTAVSTQLNSFTVEAQAPVASVSTLTIANQSLKQNTNQNAPVEIQTYTATPSEQAEVNDWYVQHGRHSNNDEYDSYDQVTLEKLAATGDMRAMHALARVYVDTAHLHLPEYGFDAAINQLWNATVHGSTQAFTDIAIDIDVRVYDHEKDEVKKRAAGLEELALYKVQELRGDRMASNSYVEKRVNPSSTEQQFINARAQQIYNELQEKRRALGLGDFDNSVPDTVNRFFKLMEKSK